MNDYQIDSSSLILALRRKEIALKRAKYQYKATFWERVKYFFGINNKQRKGIYEY